MLLFLHMRNRFEIPFGGIIDDYQERVIKNAMVIDPFANVEVFADVSPIHLAVMHDRLGDAGVLLAISESSQDSAMKAGHTVKFSYTYEEPSQAQVDILTTLASCDLENGELLDKDIKEASLALVPGLWFSDIAILADGLRFRNGNFHSMYTNSVEYISDTIRDAHTEAHGEFNAAIRTHLKDNHGVDMSQIPKPVLDDQRRQRELVTIDPKFSKMLARIQELQLYSYDLQSSIFVVSAAKAYMAQNQ